MFTYRPNTIPQNIYVVGCGGTGSRLVPLLVQFIRTITKAHNPRGWLNDTNIVLIDGDIVEEKNLLRQNFILSDVNKNKAAVLAQRYGKAYGMNVIAYPEFITDEDCSRGNLRQKISSTLSSRAPEMILMCVDSADARRKILKAFANPEIAQFYIDAGNEDDFGQVRFFTSSVLSSNGKSKDSFKEFKNPERVEVDHVIDFIPYDKGFYDNLADNPGLGSCADLNQTLAINAMMATLMIGVVQNYYYVKPFTYNEIAISLGGSVSMTYNTVSNFRNKVLFGYDNDQVGYGQAYGLHGAVRGTHAYAFFTDYFELNRRAIARLEREQLLARRKAEDAAKKKEEADALKTELQKDVKELVKKRASRKAVEVVEAVETVAEVEAVPTVAVEQESPFRALVSERAGSIPRAAAGTVPVYVSTVATPVDWVNAPLINASDVQV